MGKLDPEKKESFLKKNRWTCHLKEFRSKYGKALRGKSQREVLKLAKASYKPTCCPYCNRDYEHIQKE